jgi:hypothetical protein
MNAIEFEFQFTHRLEMPVDDSARHRFNCFGQPARIAVFIDDGCANAFDEVVPGNASERNTVILRKTLLNSVECRRRADIAQRHFEGRRRGFTHDFKRRSRRLGGAGAQSLDDFFDLVGAIAGVNPSTFL